jgi:hypothetical protein
VRQEPVYEKWFAPFVVASSTVDVTVDVAAAADAGGAPTSPPRSAADTTAAIPSGFRRFVL